ncbi:MAG: hypothetical protein LBK13_01945 [Spirochaetales bacterium]|nr:hypothetical protein [Spirochaetales bacterium]
MILPAIRARGSKSLFNIFMISIQYRNLGAFLAQSAKKRAFRSNLLAAPKGFPLQSLARAEAFPVIEQVRKSLYRVQKP